MKRNKGKIAAFMVLAVLAAGILIFVIVYSMRQGTSNPSGISDSSGTSTGTAVNSGAASIHLAGDDTTVSGSGVALEQRKVIISHGGTYHLDGTLEEGQIYIKVGDEDTVTLSMEGVTLSNKTAPAIEVENAKETILTSEGDAENVITSGSGTTVNTNKQNQVSAIHSRDDLTVEKGTYMVSASGDGLHANDDITIKGGSVTIQCGDDGIHANEELKIKDGSVIVKGSNEGLEANQITIEGGEHSITASDDGINANGGQNSFGGGHGGFDKRNENGNGQEDEDETADEGTDDDTNAEKTPNLIISGGRLTVNAEGDGLDSNGNLIVTGGEIVVDGPSSDGNGALDSGSENGGACRIDGGTLIAVGSSGMAETFDSSSAQCSFRYNFETRFEAGTEISVLDDKGEEILHHVNVRAASSIVFSSPKLEKGKTYTIKAGDQTEEITLEDISSSFGAATRGMGGGFHGGHGSGDGDAGGHGPRDGGIGGHGPGDGDGGMRPNNAL